MRSILLVSVLVASIAFANDAFDNVGTERITEETFSQYSGPIWDGPMAVLYDNGPWFNSVGTGVGGNDESILQSWGGTYGWGCQEINDNIVADDFVVPSGQTWTVTSLTVAGYQTNSGTTPTINGLYLALFDDEPPTATAIYGDLVTNVFSSAAWTTYYRVNEAGSGTSAARPIMAVTADLASSWTLTEGTYWLAFQLAGTASSGPWTPPVVIWDTPITGNGIQSVDNGMSWAPAENNPGNYSGFLFIVEGTTTALQRDTWGHIKSVF